MWIDQIIQWSTETVQPDENKIQINMLSRGATIYIYRCKKTESRNVGKDPSGKQQPGENWGWGWGGCILTDIKQNKQKMLLKTRRESYTNCPLTCLLTCLHSSSCPLSRSPSNSHQPHIHLTSNLYMCPGRPWLGRPRSGILFLWSPFLKVKSPGRFSDISSALEKKNHHLSFKAVP